MTQVGQALYTEDTAGWEELGTVFDESNNKGMTSEEAAHKSGANFLVEKEEIQIVGSERRLKNHRALVRQDTGEEMWVVGKDYQIHQNHEAFSFLDGLVMDGIMRYESAFVLKGGRQFVLQARMPNLKGDYEGGDDIAKGDEMYRYLILSQWHGGGGIDIIPLGWRLWCANQVRMAVAMSKVKMTIRHSGNLKEKFRQANLYISQFHEGFTNYRDFARKLLVGASPKQIDDYINELFPAPPKPKDTSKSDKGKAIWERKISEIRKAYHSPAQSHGEIRGTMWAIYNAVTAAVDHGKLFSESKDVRARRENRFKNITDGPGAVLKDKAFQLALEMAA